MKNWKKIYSFALTIAMIIVMLVYIKITMEGGHVDAYRWILTGGFGLWFAYDFYSRTKL